MKTTIGNKLDVKLDSIKAAVDSMKTTIGDKLDTVIRILIRQIQI